VTCSAVGLCAAREQAANLGPCRRAPRIAAGGPWHNFPRFDSCMCHWW